MSGINHQQYKDTELPILPSVELEKLKVNPHNFVDTEIICWSVPGQLRSHALMTIHVEKTLDILSRIHQVDKLSRYQGIESPCGTSLASELVISSIPNEGLLRGIYHTSHK